MEFREHRPTAEWQAAARRQIAVKCAFVTSFLLVATIIAGPAADLRSNVVASVPVVAFAGAMFFFMMRRRLKREWGGFRIYLDDSSITRRYPGVADLKLRREQVVDIRETPGSGLVVMAEKPPHVVVPALFEGYSAIRDVLASWRPLTIQSPPKVLTSVARAAAVAGPALLIATVFGSKNPQIVVPAGSLAVVVLSIAIVSALRTPFPKRWMNIYVLVMGVGLLLSIGFRVWTLL